MLKVAKLSYEEGLTNQSIGENLHKSPHEIKWVLDESVKWIIREQERAADMEGVRTPENDLEHRLREKFKHLRKVEIVPGGEVKTEEDYAELIQKLAVATALYFDKLVDDGMLLDEDGQLHVDMSGGETLLEGMSALPDRTRRNVHLYATALIGRLPFLSTSHGDPRTNATLAWARSGRLPGRCLYATVPPYNFPIDSRMSLADRKDHIAG